MREQELWDLERELWLSGFQTYDKLLAPTCLMVFPPPAGVLERQQIMEAIAAAPRWTGVDFTDQHLTKPCPELAVLAYRAMGHRSEDASAYKAQCSSVYLRTKEGWQMVLHQQTPLPD